jgi:hypothetical protein
MDGRNGRTGGKKSINLIPSSCGLRNNN